MASGSYDYYLPPFFGMDDLSADSLYHDYNADSKNQAALSQDQVEYGPSMSLVDYSWDDFTGGALSAGGFQIGGTSASRERGIHASRENHTAAEEANTATLSNAPLAISTFTGPVEDAYWDDLGIPLNISLPNWFQPPFETLYNGALLNGSTPDCLDPFGPDVHREVDLNQKAEGPSRNPVDTPLRMPEGELSHFALTPSNSISTASCPLSTSPSTPHERGGRTPQRVVLRDATNRVVSAPQCPASPKAREPAEQDQPSIVSNASSARETSLSPGPELPQQDADPGPPVSAAPSSAKRKRRVTKRSVIQPSPVASGEPGHKKAFSIDVRESIRGGGKFHIVTETIESVSCCELVGDKGLCKFTTMRDGVEVVCNQELPKNDKVVRRHLAIHLEELGYLKRAAAEGKYVADCPWCGESPTLFDGLTRHILYTELKINTILCGCGGTNSRDNQRGNKGRHENSERHQAYLRRKAKDAEAATAQEGGVRTERPEETSWTATKDEIVERHASLLQGKRTWVLVEEREEFVQGSSRGVKRRRSI